MAGPTTTAMRSSGRLRNDRGEEDALVVLVARCDDDNGGEKDSATRPPRTTDAATTTATRRTKGGDDDDDDDDDDFGMRQRPLLPGEDGGRVSPLMVFARGEGEFLFLLLFLSLLLVEERKCEGQGAMRCRLGCVATKNLEKNNDALGAMDWGAKKEGNNGVPNLFCYRSSGGNQNIGDRTFWVGM